MLHALINLLARDPEYLLVEREGLHNLAHLGNSLKPSPSSPRERETASPIIFFFPIYLPLVVLGKCYDLGGAKTSSSREVIPQL